MSFVPLGGTSFPSPLAAAGRLGAIQPFAGGTFRGQGSGHRFAAGSRGPDSGADRVVPPLSRGPGG
jgi:hypothetical protein